MIGAMKIGVVNYLVGKLGTDAERIRVCDGGDGRPGRMYKPGMRWFVGVYFTGSSGGGVESHARELSLGIDVTWHVGTIPTQVKGDELAKIGSQDETVDKIIELICGGRSLVATACNAALAGMGGNGAFHENFSSYTCSGVKNPDSVSWLLAHPPSAPGTVPGSIPAVNVMTLNFRGLKYRKNLAQLFGG